MHWWQSKPTDGSIGGWGSDPLSFSLCLFTPSTTKEFTTSKNERILRILPQLLNLTTSETKEFCEASSIFELFSTEPAGSCHYVLHLFHSICLKSIVPATRKKWGQVIRSAAPATQNHLTWPKCNPSQRPEEMSLVLRLPRDMHLCSSSSKSSSVPPLQSFLQLLQNPHVVLTFP